MASLENVSSALACVVDERSPTPFEEFMSRLLERRSKSVRVLAGSAIWTDLPIEEMVMDGLWIVMGAVAGKLGVTMNTETQAWDDMAPRVNRMVNAGLVLAYGTMKEAAAAFRTQVIGAVQDKLAHLPDGEIPVMASLWQDASMRFFAALVKRAREEGEKIGKLSHLLQRKNAIDGVEDVTYASSDPISRAEFYVRCLRIETRTDQISGAIDFRDLAGEQSTLKVKLAEQQALRRLPIRLDRLPERIDRWLKTIETSWLQTQLMLAVIDALPEKEHLEADEYRQALSVLRKSEEDASISRFYRRMRERGTTIGEPSSAMITPLLRRAVRGLRNFPETIGVQTLQDLFLLVRVEHVKLDEEEAKEYASLSGIDVPGTTEQTSKDTAKFAEQVAGEIDWQKFRVSGPRNDLDALMNAEFVTPEILASHLHLMPKETRSFVVHRILEKEYLDKKTMSLLLRQGFVTVTPDLLDSHLRYFTKQRLRKILAHMDHETVERCLESDRDDVLPRMLLRLDAADAREILSRPKRRRVMQAMFTELAVHFEALVRPSSRAFLKRLAAHLGTDLWTRYILACEINYRDGIYAGVDTENDPELAEGILPPWERIAEQDKPNELRWCNLSASLAASQEEAREALRQYPEDEIFSWLYAGCADVKKRLVKYRANRKRYYARKVKR